MHAMKISQNNEELGTIPTLSDAFFVFFFFNVFQYQYYLEKYFFYENIIVVVRVLKWMYFIRPLINELTATFNQYECAAFCMRNRYRIVCVHLCEAHCLVKRIVIVLVRNIFLDILGTSFIMCLC